MGIRSRRRSRSRAPPPPPSSSMSSPWEEVRPSTRVRLSSSPRRSDMAAIKELTDDLIVEILSRVPAKSLCRFKCVSKGWLNLIDHPDHRKRLAQPLAGFFYNSSSQKQFFYNSSSQKQFPGTALHFFNASGSDRPLFYPSFDFLPEYRRLYLIDCCNGLLLCYWDDASTTRGDDSYLVCNPATEQWMVLPEPDSSEAGDCRVGMSRLGFDPAVSSHFHVFLLLDDVRGRLTGVYVYSSETGTWIYKKDCGKDVSLAEPRSATVFVNGCLHFRTRCGWERACLAAVDTKGGTWSSFDAPCDVYAAGEDYQCHGLIQQSQGRLNYLSLTIDDYFRCEVYVKVYALEDYANKRWTLKHRIAVEEDSVNVFDVTNQEYFFWTAIHPDRNLIFIIGGSLKRVSQDSIDHNPCGGTTTMEHFDWTAVHADRKLIYSVRGGEKRVSRYSIDHGKGRGIHRRAEFHPPYMPYVPLYADLKCLRT